METGARGVQIFRGHTMDEALEKVRSAMGRDAVILQARDLRSRSWWGFRSTGVEVVAGLPAHERRPGESSRTSPGDLEREVQDLKWAVERMMNRGGRDLSENEPRAVAAVRCRLLEQGVPETLALRLADTAAGEAGTRDDEARIREALVALLARMLPTSGPPRITSQRTTRIALVGATGVGKTTTIAKLAAHVALKERRSCGFLAADTYRIAAVDQLKRYAQLMAAPMRVARTADEVSRAVGQLSCCDVVFIDTAGRSPRDGVRMEELRTFLKAARADEVHLVLSLTADTQALFAAIDRFKPLGVNRLILTKLDECERTGPLLQAIARAGLAVSHVTTGQEVPDDIVLADSRALARAVMDGPDALLCGADAERQSLRRSA